MTVLNLTSVDETGHFERLCTLLESIDEAHAGQSGSIVFGNGKGVVLVQDGRVCWAASPAAGSRLSHRLRDEASVDPQQLAAVFRECRENGKPLGQTLVERGVVRFDVLRAALLQHTAETLLYLAGHASPQWMPSRVDHYDSRFTFTSAELLTHSADGWWGPLAAGARQELMSALGDRGTVGLAFLRAEGAVIPVGITGAETLGAKETLAAGRAAVALMRSCEPLGGRLVARTHGDGRTFLVWRDRGAYYVAIARERSEIAFIVAHVSRRPPE